MDSKNDQNIRVVPVTYSKEKVRPFVERLKDVQEMKQQYIVEGILPNRKAECQNPKCKRADKCNMRDACWKIGKGRAPLNLKEKSTK